LFERADIPFKVVASGERPESVPRRALSRVQPTSSEYGRQRKRRIHRVAQATSLRCFTDPEIAERSHGSLEESLVNGRYESKRVIIPVDCQHMTNTELQDKAHAAALRHLQELVVALDRRVPQIERAGEIDIAHDTAVLKAKALERIAELERPA
jgi:hypothetical protein